MSRFFAASVTLAAEGCAGQQRDAAPGHDSLATLAYSPGKTYSAFAYRADEMAEICEYYK